MDIDKLLDETVEKTANMDGWISRKASLKIEKAKGAQIPKYARENMKGMTDEMRQKYMAILLRQKEKQKQLKKKKDDYANKMKTAQINRKIQNANLLSSWKERKRAESKKVALARARAQIANKIAQHRMGEQKALVVRNATQPELIKAQAEKARVISGRSFGKRIDKNNASFELAVRPTDKTPTSGSPIEWVRYLRHLYQDCLTNTGVNYTDQFKQAVLGIPQDVLVRMPKNILKEISKLRTKFANPAMAGIGGLGHLTTRETENIKGKIKRDFLITVAKSKATIDPSDKMNVMRAFWDKWQPTFMSAPNIYRWFTSDNEVVNAIADFRGIGEWSYRPERKYVNNATNQEKQFLLDDRPGAVNVHEAIRPLAYDEGGWDVEALMPNVPTPQPNLGYVPGFTPANTPQNNINFLRKKKGKKVGKVGRMPMRKSSVFKNRKVQG